MKEKHNIRKFIFLIYIVVSFQIGCKITFSGVNLPPEVKTISISTFFNEAVQGPANLDIFFTETVKDYYQRNTPLDLVPINGDLQLSGIITSYKIAPIAPGAGSTNNNNNDQSALLQRLTIDISVEFVNLFSEEENFSKRNFSYFSDFSAEENLSDVEDKLIEEIFEQIIFEIFNATVANW